MVGFSLYPGAENEAIVITREGQLWRVGLERDFVELFGDVSDRLRSGGEEGLLGIAFSPDFEADRSVYLYYTVGAPEPSRLSRFQVGDDDRLDATSEHVVLEVPQPYQFHNGGQLAFGPDGYLYVGLGDGGIPNDEEGHGQNRGTLLGSILRIDVTGEEGYVVPDDNPFVGEEGASPELYAYGFRNPWRFSFDEATGDLWIADVGQDRWEEVNRGIAGGNYGWSIMEGPQCFQSLDCDQAGLELPRASYPHEGGNCAVIGGHVYRGEAMPELTGWYIFGDLCTGTIWAFDTATDADPKVLIEEGPQIAAWGVLPDGELVALTFEPGLFRLSPPT